MEWFRNTMPREGKVYCQACEIEVSADTGGRCAHLLITADRWVFGDRSRINGCRCGSCEWFTHDGGANLPDPIPSRDEDEEEESVCCYSCNQTASDLYPVRDRYDSDTHRFVCEYCRDRRYVECWSCEDFVHSYSTSTVRTNYGNDSVEVCTPCINGNTGDHDFGHCSHCGDTTDESEPCCDVEDNGTVNGCTCYSCETTRPRFVHDYSYKPSPVFHRADDEEPAMRKNRFNESYDTSLYMGVELEVETSGDDEAAEAVQATLGDIVYLKDDSSINCGFEIVSHPATFRYWMEKFNWAGIRKLRADRTISTSSSCGLHIHVSKNAFSGPTHEYRWIMFWHRNQSVLKALAGRDSHYGSYDNDQRAKLVDVVKKGAHSYRRSAINTQNDYTHEVRVFASTVYVNRIKAAIQLVESTIQYTRNLAAAKVMKDGGYSWVEYIVYLRAQGTRYEQLIKRIVDLDIDREPRRQVEGSTRWDDSTQSYRNSNKVIQEGARI